MRFDGPLGRSGICEKTLIKSFNAGILRGKMTGIKNEKTSLAGIQNFMMRYLSCQKRIGACCESAAIALAVGTAGNGKTGDVLGGSTVNSGPEAKRLTDQLFKLLNREGRGKR